MTRISPVWLADDAAQRLCATLTNAGHQALFVGGCVRDALLGIDAQDIDISTDATPETVMSRASDAGFKVVPTGIDHGTVTVVSGKRHFEVTTFRRDVETDGRRAVVSFTDSVVEDARRRDFTINALYAQSDGTLIDPLQGLDDLNSRRVRFIGDAGERIREDYLRSLRFFRFHARFGDPTQGIDADALDAIARNLDGLDRLSSERITAETLKLLDVHDPTPAVASMAAVGALARVLPGADTGALGPLVHLEQQYDFDPEPLRRLAALGGDRGRLRLSKAQQRYFEDVANCLSSPIGPAEIGYRYPQIAADILLLRAATQGEQTPEFDAATRGANAVFPVLAADLMPQYQGRELGDALRALENRWIAADFRLTKPELLRSLSSGTENPDE